MSNPWFGLPDMRWLNAYAAHSARMAGWHETPPAIHEADLVDPERELFTTPAVCEECGAVVTLGDLDAGLCWTCLTHYESYE